MKANLAVHPLTSDLRAPGPGARGKTAHYFVINPQQVCAAGRIPILQMRKLRLRSIWQSARVTQLVSHRARARSQVCPIFSPGLLPGGEQIRKVQRAHLPDKRLQSSVRKGPMSQTAAGGGEYTRPHFGQDEGTHQRHELRPEDLRLREMGPDVAGENVNWERPAQGQPAGP